MWRNYLKEHQIQVETWMQSLVPAQPGPLAQVMESMRYSLFAGGKRLRPILLMAAADALDQAFFVVGGETEPDFMTDGAMGVKGVARDERDPKCCRLTQ